MWSLLRLMRPGDWVKNVFVLPALVFGNRRDEPEAILLALMAVGLFCALSSGIYALNDVIDAERDRKHPVKRKRPVASGAVTPQVATALGVTLVIGAVLGGYFLTAGFGTVLLLYLLLQVAYNAGLKRVILVDVAAIAVGFSLRAAGGALAIEVSLSIWLLLCVFFLCLYLGFIKRLCDYTSAHEGGATDWTSPAGYDNRSELDWLLGVSAVLAIVTYLMYAMSEHVGHLFGPRGMMLAVLSPLVLIAIHRFYRRASLGRSDSPLSALRHDPVVAASVVCFAIGVLAMLYVPAMDDVFRSLLSSEPAASAGPGG